MGGGGGGEEGNNLEFTPTWVVAVVCSVIVAASFAAERFLHYGGTFLKKKNQKPLYEALLKIKEGSSLLSLSFYCVGLTDNSFQQCMLFGCSFGMVVFQLDFCNTNCLIDEVYKKKALNMFKESNCESN